MSIDIKSDEILSKLKSTDSEIVLETIGKVRVSGSSLLLGEIIELFHNTEHPEIKKSLLNLMSELKDKESVNVLIAAIKNEKYSKDRAALVACCWQNGLIYNEHLAYFIDLVIHEEFLIAFEAFTVIENMYGRIGEEVIDHEVLKVNKALKSADEQKAYLLNGLLTIIQDIPEKHEYAD